MLSLQHTQRRESDTGRTSGFTLVELLVVIAIIGVLVSLLLPAVQAAREAARRCSCQNNIAQLALAVHNYEFSVEHLPAGTINPTGPIRSEAEGQHVSWLVQILPYMEQNNAYMAFDQEAGAYAKRNADVRALRIPILFCPSFPGDDKNRDSTAARTTYAGCHNDVEAPIDADNHGVLILNKKLQFCDILDGSSQTLLLGEYRADEDELGWVSGTRATLRNTGSFDEAARRWQMRVEGAGEMTPANPLEVGGFSSAHPGGAQFALADGSCHFLSEDIDPETLHQLGHRADGKLMSW
jgi:prepilin-type N-terminal cleavage/methylation domain-containing protein